ncbi:MAG TPA: haloacid dehalogenase type II [Terriglobales bacterium]|nr:haloacid dehalogenase type II [Terriglobales bacterium]
MDFSRFTTITFDCYGTLINWEAGILPTLRSVLDNHGSKISDSEILELYGEFEAEAESGAYRNYKEVLRSVVCAFAARFQIEASPAEIDSLAESVAWWPPFPDTVTALQNLKQRYRLAIISNIDDDLFAKTRKLLGVDFDAVITAEQARSYKPSINNFKVALRQLAISPDRLLHAGQSIYHDVVPARSLGISTVWVNRKSARHGIGAVRPSHAAADEQRPDLEVPDLASLASAAIEGSRG